MKVSPCSKFFVAVSKRVKNVVCVISKPGK